MIIIGLRGSKWQKVILKFTWLMGKCDLRSDQAHSHACIQSWKISRAKRWSAAYLYGLLDVDAGAPDGAEQVVEAAHLLHQHRVHALLVAGGEAPQRRLQVEVRRQLAQDVGCHFKHHVVGGFGVSASGARLIRDTERRSEQGGVSLKMTVSGKNDHFPLLLCHIMNSSSNSPRSNFCFITVMIDLI